MSEGLAAIQDGDASRPHRDLSRSAWMNDAARGRLKRVGTLVVTAGDEQRRGECARHERTAREVFDVLLRVRSSVWEVGYKCHVESLSTNRWSYEGDRPH